MSIKAKTGIDMCFNQLINAVLQNLASTSAPDSPVEGSFYWSTTEKTLKIYDGTAWQDYNPRDTYQFGKAADGVLQIWLL